MSAFLLDNVEQFSIYNREVVLLMAAGLGVPLLALPWRWTAVGVAALAGVWLAAQFAFGFLPDHFYVATSVEGAAGASAYFGNPYVPSQVGAALLNLAIVAAFVAGVVIDHRRGRGDGAAASGDLAAAETRDAAEASHAAIGPRARMALTAGGVALAALTLFPNLRDGALAAASSELPDQWDIQNGVAWQWLLNEAGAVPMKDFFWPYGLSWLYIEFPLGPLWNWIGSCVIFATSAWALWRLGPEEGRGTRVVLAVLVIPVIGLWDGHFPRYVIPFVAAAVYAGLGPARHTRLTWGHAVFAVAIVHPALYALDLLIMSVVGCATVLLGELLAGGAPWRPRILLRRLAIDAVPFAGVLLVPVVWLLLGSFDGYWRFYTELRATSAATAGDQVSLGALAHYIGLRPTIDMLRVAIPALTLTAGLTLRVFGRERGTQGAARLLLAAAGVSFMIELKHLARADGNITLLDPMLASLWACVLVWTSRRLLLSAAVGAYVALMIFTFERTDTVEHYYDGYLQDIPARVVNSFDLIGREDDVERVDEARFLRGHFPSWAPEQAMATELSQSLAGAPDKSFAVLGDAQILYVWFDQRPPFQVTLYDASRLSEQEEVVERLRQENPAFIFWRRDIAIDGVPQTVRTPIIFRYVVDNYVPVRQSDVGDVLARRGRRQIAVKYWTKRLTNSTALGFVPASSTADDSDECDGGNDCVPYVMLEGKPRGKQVTSFRITGRGRTFRVSVSTRPEENEYPVRLDRLWFWSLVGPSPTVQALRPGWKSRVVNLRAGSTLW